MTMTKRLLIVVTSMACLAWLGACKVQTGVTGPTVGETAAAAPAEAGTTAAESGDSSTADSTGGAQCPNPENHCLDDGTLFIAEQGWQEGYVTVAPATQTEPPGSSGEAAFRKLSDAGTVRTKHYWKTRPAASGELRIGLLAVAHDRADGDTYVGPIDRDQARHDSWFLAKITSLEPLADGKVWVSGGYLVATDNLRLVEGDSSPTADVPGAEDRWFIKDGHWFVGTDPLPKEGYTTVYAAALLEQATKETGGEGHFLWLHSGKTLWSRHFWKTRIAGKNDLKVGRPAICLDGESGDGAYGPPADRRQALFHGWFAGPVTDTGELYKGVVEVAGYKCDLQAVRVPVN
jgi:hypothetical protein